MVNSSSKVALNFFLYHENRKMYPPTNQSSIITNDISARPKKQKTSFLHAMSLMSSTKSVMPLRLLANLTLSRAIKSPLPLPPLACPLPQNFRLLLRNDRVRYESPRISHGFGAVVPVNRGPMIAAKGKSSSSIASEEKNKKKKTE
ncbi:hypothetical protein EYC84_003481 [Monilinia fructicola]|uniref:Uncharacterized protein n=1 Tax=Monilinia fructicola TaxID=38448 RepID=A0A5M9JWC0_MONFR|nr:hypothetical protein EYC84_003481 [Monilinia fructicola]